MTEPMQSAVTVRVTPDRLKVLVDCQGESMPLETLVESICAQLVSAGFRDPPDAAWLDGWLRQEIEQHGPHFRESVLMEGRAPTPPEHGRIEWAANFFEEGFLVDERSGAIDFRRRLAQRSVQEGQLLATLIPPKPGADGVDVFGDRIRAPLPDPVRLRTGENVRKDDSSSEVCATASGRIRWDGNTLSVDKVYCVQGRVGLETGHISHPGALEVGMDITEGSIVETEGDIEVGQIIESASVTTRGNLVVRGGIMGGVSGVPLAAADPGRSGSRLIRAAGSLYARFILDADIEVGQDVVVEREIVHSRLRVRGCLNMPRGRLLGGEAIVLGGVTIGQAGSVASIPTSICVGADYVLEESLPEKEARLAALSERFAAIHKKLVLWRGRADLLPSLREEAARLAKEEAGIKADMAGINEEIDAMRTESLERAKFLAIVKTIAYPETVFHIGRERLVLDKETPGPFRVFLEDGAIRFAGPK